MHNFPAKILADKCITVNAVSQSNHLDMRKKCHNHSSIKESHMKLR